MGSFKRKTIITITFCYNKLHSKMNFSKPTLLAALAAAPIATSAYNVGPRYSSSPMLLSSSSPVSRIIEKQRMIAQRMFDMVDQQQAAATLYSSSAAAASTTHRYELVDNNEKFELTVDVPGVKEDDIEIKLEDNLLTVQGQRMAASKTSKFSSKFSKTFSLDQTVDVEKFTASLKNGVLTVSAPKDLAKLEENIRRIPVMSAAAATVDDDAAEPAIASGDTESDSQKMEHKEDEAEEASMDLDKENEDTSSNSPKDAKE